MADIPPLPLTPERLWYDIRRLGQRLEDLEFTTAGAVADHGNADHTPDFQAGGEAPTAHKDSHKDGGSDAFLSTDPLRASVHYLGAPGAHGEAFVGRAGGLVYFMVDQTASDYISYDPVSDEWKVVLAG